MCKEVTAAVKTSERLTVVSGGGLTPSKTLFHRMSAALLQ